MNKVAIIGAGISGVSSARILKEKGFTTTIFEKRSGPGGLIRCTYEDGNLFHRVGGHVFNTKVENVKTWFWNKFDQKDFLQAQRRAKIFYDGNYIGYPIENYIYQLPESLIFETVNDLLTLLKSKTKKNNFEDYLKNTFGLTLYNYYFKPYNSKIWNYDLKKIPLPWLEGKLPMPKIDEILVSNILKVEEDEMVHSSFFYPKEGGSSFIIEKLLGDQKIILNTEINKIQRVGNKWEIENDLFDSVIYTGDVRLLNNVLCGVPEPISRSTYALTNLPSNATTTVLCYTNETNLSWLYLPSPGIKSHRIIYTGNFSNKNNNQDMKSCTVEFSGLLNESTAYEQIKLLPGNLKPIAINREPNSYVIQEFNTRKKIQSLKNYLKALNFHLVGRFAEWEYYNMDMAINSALSTLKDY